MLKSYLLKPVTSQKNFLKRPETTQNFEIREIKFLAQMSKFRSFGPKSINFLIFQHVPYFESADLKSGICFPKFWAQMPNFGHSGSKSINFLILTKFPLYPVSKVLISNLTFVFQDFEPK